MVKIITLSIFYVILIWSIRAKKSFNYVTCDVSLHCELLKWISRLKLIKSSLNIDLKPRLLPILSPFARLNQKNGSERAIQDFTTSGFTCYETNLNNNFVTYHVLGDMIRAEISELYQSKSFGLIKFIQFFRRNCVVIYVVF